MDLLAVGDNVFDCYVDQGLVFPGGNCVNVAVRASRAGTATAYLGVVGDDEYGAVMVSALIDERVDVSRVKVVAGPTSRVIVRHIEGERHFAGSIPGARAFVPDAGDLAFASRFSLAHVSYCSGLDEHVPALAARVPISYDFDDRVFSDWAEGLLPHVRVAVFSASDLSPADCDDLVGWAHDRGAQWVLATRGAAGAVVSDGSTRSSASAPATRIVDTLGAGDAFIGRALHGLLRREPVAVLTKAAVAAGSAACLEQGGFGHGTPLKVKPDLRGASR